MLFSERRKLEDLFLCSSIAQRGTSPFNVITWLDANGWLRFPGDPKPMPSTDIYVNVYVNTPSDLCPIEIAAILQDELRKSIDGTKAVTIQKRERELQVGDVVKMKSCGGPEMVIEEITGDQATCVWILGHNPQRFTTDKACLKRVDPVGKHLS